VTAVITKPRHPPDDTVDAPTAPDILLTLYAIAAREITLHAFEHGVCAHCGCAWPCDVAVLAEHNLAL
jgi:hypothetical protein